MITKKLFTIICLLFFMGGLTYSQSYKYIGAPKCKMCHNKPNKGEQYNKWFEGPHANAMKSLSAEEAKDPKCLKCHSTAASIEPKEKGGINIKEGVSCEACHGPGSMYKSPALMKNRKAAMAKGLIVPDEALCRKCHNEESPTFKGFNYEEYLAKIAHPDPTLKK